VRIILLIVYMRVSLVARQS